MGDYMKRNREVRATWRENGYAVSQRKAYHHNDATAMAMAIAEWSRIGPPFAAMTLREAGYFAGRYEEEMSTFVRPDWAAW